MSVEAISWALRQKTGSMRTKLVLIVLANYADAKGRAWPSQRHLAKICEISVRQLRRYITELEGLALLRRQGRWKLSGGRFSDLYELALGEIVAPAELNPRDTEPDFFDPDVVFGGGTDTLKAAKSAEADTDVPYALPSANPRNPPKRTSLSGMKGTTVSGSINDDTKAIDTRGRSAPSLVPQADEIEAGWQRFKEVFPKTRWRDAKKCRTRFYRIVTGRDPKLKATIEEIVTGAERYAELVDPQWARMPYTWINNANWNPEENYGVTRSSAKSGATLHDQRGAIARAVAGELEN